VVFKNKENFSIVLASRQLDFFKMPLSTKSTFAQETELAFINDVKDMKVNHEKPIVRDGIRDIMLVTEDNVDDVMDRLAVAQDIFSSFTQAKVDFIVEAAADHFIKKAKELGIMAFEETGMGNPDHKEAKNMFAVDYVRRWYRKTKTCGVISHDEENDLDVVASPMGIILAVIPTTNPTSTIAFKALCCLKTRNAIICGPHPRAKKCTTEALRLIMEGAVAAGAPENLAACTSEPSVALTGSLMQHAKISLVLATGGPGLVKAAYSSGHPAIGVGPGNVPVVVDEFANLRDVALNVVSSKNFDNGVICSSEQVIVAHSSVSKALKEEFVVQGAHFLNDDEKDKVGKLLFKDGGALNADVVGQTPLKIATMASIDVPDTVTLLIGEFDDVQTSAFAKEKLSPVLGFTTRDHIDELFDAAVDILRLGGEGHTACFYTNATTQLSRISRFSDRVIVTRCLINQPTAPGGIGGVYNFGISPSMTLGCGSYGGNYVSDNVGPMHLLNYKRIATMASDHTIVLKNIDCLVPPHIATRCAMELFILTITIVAKDISICEPHPELHQVYAEVKMFLEGTGSLKKLRECILYFMRNGLYSHGNDQLALQSVCQEFNIPRGNLYPILFPAVSKHFEGVTWSNLRHLDESLLGLDEALEIVRHLSERNNMVKSITPSTLARIKRGGVSVMSKVIEEAQ